ncbi:hypothetical protein WH50_17355 [Pokkaliibacter plantistimulans]|uniref:Uncharacterized protein n=2 Tax=Pokkaliibacter plantistimulans TaxID=1635171 RepID=A0ABX5LV83_9GAMM|nr:hypothetical protein WH50_17355 [Pokkaliibacter plantistimulans]
MLLSLPFQPAQASTDATRLIEGCTELVNVYTKRDELRFAAAQTTSLSEAMRAGYCRGVLDEYQRHNYCTTQDWRKLANTIASQALEQPQNIDSLLRKACGH